MITRYLPQKKNCLADSVSLLSYRGLQWEDQGLAGGYYSAVRQMSSPRGASEWVTLTPCESPVS